MDQVREKSQKNILGWVEDRILESIANWELKETEDYWHEETDSIIRVFYFNRGMTNIAVAINPRLKIVATSKKNNTDILVNLFNLLNDLMWQSFYGGIAVNPPQP